MILLFIWNLCFLAAYGPSRRSTKAMFLIVGLAPLLGWGLYCLAVTGEFRIGSSYDGENLFRGSNDAAYLIYPPGNLDRIFRDTRIVIEGTAIDLPPRPHPPVFDNEWRRSDWYAMLALRWIEDNPLKFVEMTARKFFVMFGEIRSTPLNCDGDSRYSPYYLAGIPWMIFARLIFLRNIMVSLGPLRRHLDQRVLVALVGLCAFYSVPYLVGFAYERHVAPLVLPTVLFFIYTRAALTSAASLPLKQAAP
jgi:hypothetical protein